MLPQMNFLPASADLGGARGHPTLTCVLSCRWVGAGCAAPCPQGPGGSERGWEAVSLTGCAETHLGTVRREGHDTLQWEQWTKAQD